MQNMYAVNQMIDKKYGSRKFIIAMLLVGCTTLIAIIQLIVCKDINFAAVAAVYVVVGAGYGLTNVMDKKVGAPK